MADFNLPNEIWCKIFSYLPLKPKKNATATCKLWSRLIREDPNLSGHILVSWYNMKTALETLQWNWLNWPALKTLELNKFKLVDSKEAIQNIIKTLSLRKCPPNIEEFLFNVDLTPIQTNDQILLKYQPSTDQIFGLGQELVSIQKWNEYESNRKALIWLESLREPAVWYWPTPPPTAMVQLGQQILAELAQGPLNDPLLLLASPAFLTFRRLGDEYIGFQPHRHPRPTDPEVVEYIDLDEFLDECNLQWP